MTAAAPVFEERRVFTGDDLQETAGSWFARLAQVAPNGDRHVLISAVHEQVRLGISGRHGFFEAFQFCLQRRFLGLRCGVGSCGFNEFFMILDGFLGGIEGVHHFTRSDRSQFDLGVVKNPCQRVVVPRGDGIELVIMTAGASHGEPEERSREGVHPIGQRLRPGLCRRLGIATVRDVSGTYREKAGRNGDIPVVRKEIARDLSPHELVIGQVAI